MAAPYNLNPSTSSHSDIPPRLHRFRLQTKDSEYPLHIQIPTPVGVDLWSVSPKGAIVIHATPIPVIHNNSTPRKWRSGTPNHSIFQPIHLGRSFTGAPRKPQTH
ncbi:hypothetical protein AVEN_200399-1 [Araneus ventricosus]|uniref:Uncharacterized protein n=1 Tax=Araneus ventricosus TaxID=182803 RepID=A0A4Y2RV88_ARAVE|nr:hypothetical protein AVEN_230409-1 [Araneus ventricosus]GBN79184.1 hypothetical protein AVEN_200399-1 [Araneus ventricosus]